MLHAMLWASVIAHPWESTMPVEVDLGAFLDEDGENRSLAEILKAPGSALQGVSEGDADLLKQAFNIKTVGDLGKNKYFRAAQLLAQLAEAGAK
jgi:hypothetical protein